MSDLINPLSEQELELLDEFLLYRIDEDSVEEGMDEGILDISELDGLLTAVVSGPVTVMPSRWLPAVWGDFEPTWHNLEDCEAVMSMLMRHMDSIAALLMQEPESFEPMFEQRTRNGKTVVVVDEWCEGYMRGVRLSAREWGEGGAEVESLLAPIRSFTEETDWHAHKLKTRKDADRLRANIAPNVRAIHAYWLARRGEKAHPSMPLRRKMPRVGRNDPCPCGSGRKYKKCCLH